MKLKALVQGLDIEIKGKKEIEIQGLCAHSKKVAPGDLFIALKGAKVDGSTFVEEAQRAGAAALLTDLYNPFLKEMTQLICKDVSKIQLELIKRFYNNPSQSLKVVGVTGTNGKTTTSYLIRHCLEFLGISSGLIGTIETIIGKYQCPSQLTTPDVLSLHKILAKMLTQKCQACVMEVSSHALIQKRLEEVEIDVAVFTNLSQDHLDYHKTMQAYFEAKKLLFTHLERYRTKPLKQGVINIDDPYGLEMLSSCSAKTLTYGIEHKGADLKAFDVHLKRDKTYFKVNYQGAITSFESPLIGKFNVYNMLAALGALLSLGLTLEQLKTPIQKFQQVPGRLQKIDSPLGFSIYVDFAHTDKALENVLLTLRPLTKGKLIVVFGCGGDRDQKKRPLMGAVASLYADTIVLTSDNPRSEDPFHIIQEIMSGAFSQKKCFVEVDRKKAIEKAIEMAKEEDSVLIAGKGHEMTQIFKDRHIAFSDALVAAQALEKLEQDKRYQLSSL